VDKTVYGSVVISTGSKYQLDQWLDVINQALKTIDGSVHVRRNTGSVEISPSLRSKRRYKPKLEPDQPSSRKETHWTEEELAHLKRHIESGTRAKEIAVFLSRTEGAIRTKASNLGLIWGRKKEVNK
jgi:DNA-binding NarL/FixJ family response regulator